MLDASSTGETGNADGKNTISHVLLALPVLAGARNTQFTPKTQRHGEIKAQLLEPELLHPDAWLRNDKRGRKTGCRRAKHILNVCLCPVRVLVDKHVVTGGQPQVSPLLSPSHTQSVSITPPISFFQQVPSPNSYPFLLLNGPFS